MENRHYGGVSEFLENFHSKVVANITSKDLPSQSQETAKSVLSRATVYEILYEFRCCIVMNVSRFLDCPQRR